MLLKKSEKIFPKSNLEPLDELEPELEPEPPEGLVSFWTATEGSQVFTNDSLKVSSTASFSGSATTIDGAVTTFLSVITLPAVVSMQLKLLPATA